MYKFSSFLGLICLYFTLLCWHFLTARALTISVMVVLAFAVLIVFALGDLLLKFLFKDKTAFDTLIFKLLSGTLVGVICLYFVTLILPYGLHVDSLLMAGVVFTTWVLVRRGGLRSALTGGKCSENAFLFIALIAVSLWCQDLLRPIDSAQTVTVIRAWGDVYYHLSQISAFAGSKGASTIYDVQMNGATAHPYHFAAYIFPALLVNGGTTAWAAYASFLVPIGILLTCLAAQALTAPIFGHWPSMVAGLALLLLPDASQYGFRNPFMGYHWLQQVGPSSCYGVACAAMATLLMIEACRSRKIMLVVASYIFVLATLVFKAQIFVAIAYVILVFPALFFAGLTIFQRVSTLLVLTTIFMVVVSASQALSSVPILRLDGSSIHTFSDLIFNTQLPGIIKSMFAYFNGAEAKQHVLFGVMFGIFLIFVSFGVLPLWYGVQIRRMSLKYERVVWLFPVLIIANYLVMALGLALDTNHIGSPEELLHRPFVWAYFVLITWTVAGAYAMVFEDNRPKGRCARNLLIGTGLLIVSVPGYMGHGIQTMKSWDQGYQQLPSCQVKTAKFIRDSSSPSDIVQDLKNDPQFILFGLSERKAFAINSGGVRVPQGLTERLQSVSNLRSLSSFDQVEVAARTMGIQWLVVGPDVEAAWARLESHQADFQCGAYQAFRIGNVNP